MEQNRSIKELLKLMLEHQHLFKICLCQWNRALYVFNIISMEEHIDLEKYIEKNRPFLSYFRIGPYYWPKYKFEPRIKWIKKHIEKLNKK